MYLWTNFSLSLLIFIDNLYFIRYSAENFDEAIWWWQFLKPSWYFHQMPLITSNSCSSIFAKRFWSKFNIEYWRKERVFNIFDSLLISGKSQSKGTKKQISQRLQNNSARVMHTLMRGGNEQEREFRLIYPKKIPHVYLIDKPQQNTSEK